MATYFYLQFPVDDAILELSNDEEKLKYFLKNILDLKRIANEKAIQIIYDNENIQIFKSEVEGLVDGFSVDIRLRNFIGKTALNFRDKPQQKNDVAYFLWLLNSSESKPLNGSLLAEIPEQWTENDQFLIISFSNEHDNQKRKFLPIYKDAWHQKDLPNFYKIDFVTDFQELELWLATHQNSDFSLLDRSRFEKTKFNSQGARIYQEIKTKWFWYLDMLHKNHYEVFDKTGKNHLGTADLDGEISDKKKDNNRTIDIT